MARVQAKAKAAERKEVEKRIGRPPKHARHAKAQEDSPPVDDTMTEQAETPAATGFSAFNQTPVQESFMSKKDATPKPDQEAIRAAAQARREAAALAKAERAAERQRAKDAKDAEYLAKKVAREEARAAKAAAREAARQAIIDAGGSYAGSMLALREAKARYVRAANGRLRSTDPLAEALDAVEPSGVVTIAKLALELSENPYTRLNIGQQSMNLRNRMRFAIKKGTLTVEDVIRIRDENDLTIPADVLEKRAARRAAAQQRREVSAH